MFRSSTFRTPSLTHISKNKNQIIKNSDRSQQIPWTKATSVIDFTNICVTRYMVVRFCRQFRFVEKIIASEHWKYFNDSCFRSWSVPQKLLVRLLCANFRILCPREPLLRQMLWPRHVPRRQRFDALQSNEASTGFLEGIDVGRVCIENTIRHLTWGRVSFRNVLTWIIVVKCRKRNLKWYRLQLALVGNCCLGSGVINSREKSKGINVRTKC